MKLWSYLALYIIIDKKLHHLCSIFSRMSPHALQGRVTTREKAPVIVGWVGRKTRADRAKEECANTAAQQTVTVGLMEVAILTAAPILTLRAHSVRARAASRKRMTVDQLIENQNSNQTQRGIQSPTGKSRTRGKTTQGRVAVADTEPTTRRKTSIPVAKREMRREQTWGREMINGELTRRTIEKRAREDRRVTDILADTNVLGDPAQACQTRPNPAVIGRQDTHILPIADHTMVELMTNGRALRTMTTVVGVGESIIQMTSKARDMVQAIKTLMIPRLVAFEIGNAISEVQQAMVEDMAMDNGLHVVTDAGHMVDLIIIPLQEDEADRDLLTGIMTVSDRGCTKNKGNGCERDLAVITSSALMKTQTVRLCDVFRREIGQDLDRKGGKMMRMNRTILVSWQSSTIFHLFFFHIHFWHRSLSLLCVCLCVKMKRMPDEWQARHVTIASRKEIKSQNRKRRVSSVESLSSWQKKRRIDLLNLRMSQSTCVGNWIETGVALRMTVGPGGWCCAKWRTNDTQPYRPHFKIFTTMPWRRLLTCVHWTLSYTWHRKCWTIGYHTVEFLAYVYSLHTHSEKKKRNEVRTSNPN